MVDLRTTNLLLGILAAVSVLEGLLIIGLAVAAYVLYGRVMELVTGLERRHVAPAMARVQAILDDVKAVSNTVKVETERVDHAIHSTMGRVDDTAQRVQAGVRATTNRVVNIARGLRTAIEYVVRSHDRREQPEQQ